MKIMALKQLQQANPTMYDPIKIDTVALQELGWSNPEQFFAPPQAQQAPPPEMVKMQVEAKAKETDSQARMIKAQADAKLADAKAGEIASGGGDKAKGLAAAGPSPLDEIKAKTALMDAHTNAKRAEIERAKLAFDDANDQEDRASKEKLELLQMGKEMILHPQEAPIAEQFVDKAEGPSKGKKALENPRPADKKD
jgi:hypothetical protein